MLEFLRRIICQDVSAYSFGSTKLSAGRARAMILLCDAFSSKTDSK